MGEFRKPHGSGPRGGGDRFGKKDFGGRPSFGGKPGFSRPGGRDSGQRELFPATCAACGKPCEVPFRPTGERPVYCRDCFGSKNPATMQGPRRDFRPRETSPMPAATFRPQTPMPAAEDKRFGEIKTQLALINAKLEAIVEMVATPKVATVVPKTETPKKVAPPKKKIAKKK
jgi:CxxC-x17-CxxC domain-containing protein